MKKITLLTSIIISLTIWVLSPMIHIIYSKIMEKYFELNIHETFDNSGKFGDSFGIATSLFSLASFASALYILYKTNSFQQLKDRPYLVTQTIETIPNIKITAESIDQIFFEAKLQIKNYSDHLAHSIKITPKIISGQHSITGQKISITRPTGTNLQEIPLMKMQINLEKDMEILNNLSSNTETILLLNLEYKNTTNKKFESNNKYTIGLQEKHEAINEIRRRHFNSNNWGKFYVACDLKEHFDFIEDKQR